MTKARSLGSHYTPPALAREHALAAMQAYNWSSGKPDHERAHIVDLACGDGALLQAACGLGVDPERCLGMDLDPEAVEQARLRNGEWSILYGDALFDFGPPEDRPYDIALVNPPWIGKVSHVCGTDYAKRIAKAYGPGYNAASDIASAFVLRASQIANQLSFITTNTAWQGRTFRSGAKRLLLSKEWAALWFHDPGARYTGLGVVPGNHTWVGTSAAVTYISFHLVRVEVERYSCFEGGCHYGAVGT